MPQVTRPDGASIHWETEGDGFPLLLFAPGGINSQVSFWRQVSAVNPFDYADEFGVIGMNQRHAVDSPGPLAAPDWSVTAADQRAVLDAAGVERALLWGGCIGVGYALRFIMEAPERVAGAVVQDPVGLVEEFNSRQTFWAMFEGSVEAARKGGMQAVVDAALTNPLFVQNRDAGPFAARIATDPQFREEVLALDPEQYAAILESWDERMWGAEGPFMSVPESFVASCPVPLLVLPGSDQFHPTATAHRICREAPDARCLDVDCRTPAKLPATRAAIREFLRSNAH